MPISHPWIIFKSRYPFLPTFVRKKIFCSTLPYHDRAFLAAFVVGNNILPSEFMRVILSVNRVASQQHFFKLDKVIEWLLDNFNNNNSLVLNTYFYYDMVIGETFYLSGREYISPSRLRGYRHVATC